MICFSIRSVVELFNTHVEIIKNLSFNNLTPQPCFQWFYYQNVCLWCCGAWRIFKCLKFILSRILHVVQKMSKHWTRCLNPCSQNFMINDQHTVTEHTSCHGNPVAYSTHFPKGNRQKRTVLWIILTKQLYCQSNCSWIITITTNRNTLTNHTADHCLQVCYVQGMLGMWIPPSRPLFILSHQAEPQESTNTQTNKQHTL